jgi:hypothetical protein
MHHLTTFQPYLNSQNNCHGMSLTLVGACCVVYSRSAVGIVRLSATSTLTKRTDEPHSHLHTNSKQISAEFRLPSFHKTLRPTGRWCTEDALYPRLFFCPCQASSETDAAARHKPCAQSGLAKLRTTNLRTETCISCANRRQNLATTDTALPLGRRLLCL